MNLKSAESAERFVDTLQKDVGYLTHELQHLTKLTVREHNLWVNTPDMYKDMKISESSPGYQYAIMFRKNLLVWLSRMFEGGPKDRLANIAILQHATTTLDALKQCLLLQQDEVRETGTFVNYFDTGNFKSDHIGRIRNDGSRTLMTAVDYLVYGENSLDPDTFDQRLSQGKGRLFISADRYVGYYIYTKSDHKNSMTVLNACVVPDFAQSGIREALTYDILMRVLDTEKGGLPHSLTMLENRKKLDGSQQCRG